MRYKVHDSYITFIIDHPISIDDFFKQMHLSKKTIHLLKQYKEYKVNQRFVSSSTILIKGDRLTIKAFQEDDHMYAPLYEDIDILYEDELILVVNKPAFMAIYPDDIHKIDSLAHRVSGYYHQQGYNIPVRYIHRLDYETSGAVLFCKCALIQPLLDYELSIKKIKRYYQAIVVGKMKDHQWHKVETMIAKDRHHSQRMRVAKDGQYALTYYRMLKSNGDLSLIECQLDTGRKHQIRVHMSSSGYPLLGDCLYYKPSPLIQRQALHAYQLSFKHPITKEELCITCPLPKDMLKIISKNL